jgi:hypothetical protein
MQGQLFADEYVDSQGPGIWGPSRLMAQRRTTTAAIPQANAQRPTMYGMPQESRRFSVATSGAVNDPFDNGDIASRYFHRDPAFMEQRLAKHALLFVYFIIIAAILLRPL